LLIGIEKLGTPTILINNAATVVGKPLLSMSLEEAHRSISTNLLGHFNTIKTFLPSMVAAPGGGTIVTVSSVLGHVGAARLADYAAAKAGVTALHKSLAAELRESHPNVKMVLVTPGQLSTPLFRGVQTPNSFIAPVVEPVDIAKEIIRVVDGGGNDDIAVPLYAKWIDWNNVLPVGLHRFARWAGGVDQGMKTWVGRDGGDEKSRSEKGF
jgi:NAD(P)-dependent dehydrogenase (short-subunit alcohol dehydrogenase family)